MPRLGLLLLVALAFLVAGAQPSRSLAQDDVGERGCSLRVVRAQMSNQTVASLINCQYDSIRGVLPGFATINWTTGDNAPVGLVLRQSAQAGTPFTRLENRFTLWVSAGPRVSISTPAAIEGGTLTFRANPPVRTSRPYGADYKLTLDSAGRREARRGTHYASLEDQRFLSGGTLAVRTQAGSGIDRLYVVVMLTYPPDGPAANTTLGTGAGRIVQYPQVRLNSPSANEGAPLNFVARIDRAGIPSDQPLSYRFAVRGDAQAGVDYAAPSPTSLTFGPGEEAATLSIRTLTNDESFEDRQLVLQVAGPGQRPTSARGTIVNTSVPPPGEIIDPIDPTGETDGSTDEGTGDELTDVVDPIAGGETGLPEERDPDETNGAGDGGDAVIDKGGGNEDATFWQLISGLGLEWLAVIGAIAIGLLGGFLFGARSQKPGASALPEVEGTAEPEPEAEPVIVPPVPLIGWTTETPKPPTVKGGSIAIDGPSITIDVARGEGKALPLESLTILPEEESDE